jgi:hypothetical protein
MKAEFHGLSKSHLKANRTRAAISRAIIPIHNNMNNKKRPTTVTVFSVFILGLALWNGLRFAQAISFWSVLREFQAEPGPLYIALSGGFWFIYSCSIAWGLWHGKAWSWFGALGGAVCYGCWYWFDSLVFQEPHSNWPFAIVSTVFLLSFFILFTRRSVLLFFPLKGGTPE